MHTTFMDWKTITDDREKYKAYLASREWAVLKRAVHQRSGGICERCKVNPLDHVHHLTYARKYNERIEDLQAQCKPCHDFTHGHSDFDPAIRPPMFMGKQVGSVYLAGTCEPKEFSQRKNWRFELTEGFFVGHKAKVSTREQVVRLSSGKTIAYSGPHIQYDHGCYITEDHGIGYRSRQEVYDSSINGIEKSDLVFAWIDREDCYGTICEIGYAVAAGTTVAIAGPEHFEQLWFTYGMARATTFKHKSPRAAFEELVK